MIVGALFLISFSSCEKAAKDGDFGDALIYIPKAYNSSDGSNNYTVKVSNYDDADTSIVIGVNRSGSIPYESATVNLALTTDSVTSAINYAATSTLSQFAIYKKCVILDPSYYTVLPDKLTIPDGQSFASVRLVLKDKLIMADTRTSDYVYAIGVKISNPTKYALNPQLSFAMIIISRNFTRK